MAGRLANAGPNVAGLQSAQVNVRPKPRVDAGRETGRRDGHLLNPPAGPEPRQKGMNMKRKVEVELDIPDDYEFVRCGPARKGEPLFVRVGGQWEVQPASRDYPDGFYVILRKVDPVAHVRWLNIYPPTAGAFGAPKNSREESDRCAGRLRLAVLRIDYEDGKPVRYTPEPLDPAPPLTQ